jgi:hypothetical protein
LREESGGFISSMGIFDGRAVYDVISAAVPKQSAIGFAMASWMFMGGIPSICSIVLTMEGWV